MKEMRGITLVALIVTIIVLLILSGITLSLIAGSNGILARATKAVDENEIASIKERVEFKIAEDIEKFHEEKYVNHSIDNSMSAYEYLKDNTSHQIKSENEKYTLIYMDSEDTDNPNVNQFQVNYVKKGTNLSLKGKITQNGVILWEDDVKIPEGSDDGEEEERTYTVVYDGNGATSGSTTSSLHVYGIEKNLTVNGFVRENYIFNGWNTKADGTGTAYANGANVNNLSETDGSEVTLYAIWFAEGYVDLGTDLLDKTIALSDRTRPATDWRIFYREVDDVWLIMSDYLPCEKNSIVGTTLRTDGRYCWWSDISGVDLIAQLKDESKWKKLLPITLQDNVEVKVTGAVELEKWVKAWNVAGGTQLYIDTNRDGYLISTNSTVGSSDYGVTGLDNDRVLFFSRKGNAMVPPMGYWSASPSASANGYTMAVVERGQVSGSQPAFNGWSVRPVVKMPSSLLTKGEDGIWKVN